MTKTNAEAAVKERVIEYSPMGKLDGSMTATTDQGRQIVLTREERKPAGDRLVSLMCKVPNVFVEDMMAILENPNVPVMARGIGGRDAPHSSKAIADNRAHTGNRADAVQAKGKAKSDIKAADPKKLARLAEKEKSKANRQYVVITKMADVNAREGTWRRAMMECVLNNKDTDSANACMLKNREFGSTHKIDFRFMVNNGHIKYKD